MKSCKWVSGTSNLWSHLLAKFKALHARLQYERDEAIKQSSNNSSSLGTKQPKALPTGTSLIAGHMKIAGVAVTAASFLFTLLMLVLNNNLPYSFVTSDTLRNLLASTGNKHAVPGRAAFLNYMVEVYQYCRTLLLVQLCTKHLQKCAGEFLAFLHLSCDFWTAKYTKQSYGTVVMA
eukprot:2461-Heterococcus_DN1.PRE.3